MVQILLENNLEITLNGDENISLNYSIADISDFVKRKSSYSRTFNAPGNKNNNLVFSHYYELGSDSVYLPNKQLKASLVVDSVQVFNGYIQLNRLNRDFDNNVISYEITFYADLNRFIKQIDSKYISDITNLSGITHVWNYDNAVNSWNAPLGYGYFYPILNKSNYSMNSSNSSVPMLFVPINDMYPGVYLKHLVDGMFRDAGYSYECDLFHSEFFKRLYIPLNKLVRDDEFVDDQKFKAVQITDRNIIWSANTGSSGYQVNDIQLDLADDYNLGYDNSNTYNPSTLKYTALNSFKASFKVGFGVSAITTPCTFTGQVELRVNGITVWSAPSGLLFTSFGYWVKNTPKIDIAAGDEVTLFFNSNLWQPCGYSILSNYTFLELSDVESDDKSIPGDLISVANNLPKISQLDLFKSLITMFNLYVLNSDDSENILRLKPRDEYYRGGHVKDWTDKLDTGSPSYFKPLSEISSKLIRFSFQKNNDYLGEKYFNRWDEVYGQNDIVIDNDYLPANSIKEVKSIFGSLENTTIKGSTEINLPVVYRLDETGSVNGVADKPVLLFNNGIRYTNENIVIQQPLTSHLINYYPHSSILLGDFNSPSFSFTWDSPQQIYYSMSGNTEYPSNNLFTTYYENTINEFTSKDSKLFTCYMNLKPSDLQNIDFADQIFLDIDGGNYFKLYEIEDYQPNRNGKCKVTLLKSLNLVPTVQNSRRYPIKKTDNLIDAIERTNYGRDNQILGDFNLLAGKSSTIHDNANYNLLLGNNNEIKPDVNNSILAGDNNIIKASNSSIIGSGSRNTIEVINSAVIGSNNIQINNKLESAYTYSNNVVLASNNLSVSGKSNIAVIGVSNQRVLDYSANTYVNGLSVFDLTGITINIAGVQPDGKLIKLPFSAVTSGITSPSINEYWTGSTGFQSLKRNNSANNQLSGEYSIITAGNNNYSASDRTIIGSGEFNTIGGANSGILSGKRNTINTILGEYCSAILAGSGNTIVKGYSSILAGQNNYVGHSFSSVLAGRNISTVSANTAHAENLFVQNQIRISGLTGIGNRMVISSSNGTLSTQSIPTSYSAKWIAGSVYSSVILNNGYTTAASDYSLVAGKVNTISPNNPYSSILGGVGNKIQDNSTTSIIVGGSENYIKNYGKYSFMGAGRSNYVINSYFSVITGGYGNRIYNNASNSESKYNSIINGYVNKINRGVNCTIIGSYNIIGNGDLIKYSFVSGKNNRLYASYSNILGCYGVTLSDNYTTLVERLQIAGTQNVANNYLLNINPSDWKVNRTSLSGGSGISITTAGGNLTITYTGSTSSLGGSSIVNGLNTYTAGTSSVQSVNISAATLNNLTVSGSTSLATVSATTIYSGSTDLSTLFQPKQTNYRQILATNYVYTSSTAVANFSFDILAGEVYKAEMFSLFWVNNTGGMKLTLSGNALFNCVVRGNTSNLLTNSLRPVNSTGNTATLGVTSNTTLSYVFEGIISARTNTTIALGFSPQTNGQQITIFSGACMTLQKI